MNHKSVLSTLPRLLTFSNVNQCVSWCDVTMTAHWLQVQYISFAAHADFRETSSFLESIQPPNIVLVHGESNEMGRLRGKLIDQFKDRDGKVLAPKNCQTVDFYFKGDKTARAVGKLAHWKPASKAGSGGKGAGRGASEGEQGEEGGREGEEEAEEGDSLGGVLVQTDFEYQLVAPEDLASYTQLSTGAVIQRQAVPYQGSFHTVRSRLERMFEEMQEVKDSPVPAVLIGERITVSQEFPDRVVLQWSSDPVADMIADSVVAVILQLEGAQTGPPLLTPKKEEGASSREEDGEGGVTGARLSQEEERRSVCDLLTEMFGEVESGEDVSVPVKVKIDQVEALVSLPSGTVECKDTNVKGLVKDAVARLLSTLRPISIPSC